VWRRYTRDELLTFLRGLDERLHAPTELLIIGGAAAALRYGATRATRDIDTWSNIPPAVLRAADEARAATGLDVPIERAAVADAPYFYEDRIRPALPRLKKLRLMVPERHDLVLMKVVRGDRHDLDVIAEIHAKHPLKLATLVKRFEEEMGHVIKDERTLRLQFRLLVEQLFGKEAARSIRATRAPGSGGHRV
jgi:Nucleotidyltransferase of unknown function (DUF6036)